MQFTSVKMMLALLVASAASAQAQSLDLSSLTSLASAGSSGNARLTENQIAQLMGQVGAADAAIGHGASGCWIDAVGRGVGRVPSTCPPARPDKQAGLCYAPCPAEHKGVGPLCWRGARAVGRGVGRIPECAGDQVRDAGLCYRGCPATHRGAGPVCWQSTCPRAFPHRCGLLCLASADACTSLVLGQATGGARKLLEALANPMVLLPAAVNTGRLLASFPRCAREAATAGDIAGNTAAGNAAGNTAGNTAGNGPVNTSVASNNNPGVANAEGNAVATRVLDTVAAVLPRLPVPTTAPGAITPAQSQSATAILNNILSLLRLFGGNM